MLTKQQIAVNLLSDIDSYKDSITYIIVNSLDDFSVIYWSAWFEGATGKDLENAERGIIFKK